MRAGILLFFTATFLLANPTAYADNREHQLFACVAQALKKSYSLDNDPDEAISNALAECHSIQADYSRAWLNDLQRYGYASTGHVHALILAHSYRTTLSYLNNRYHTLKSQRSSGT